MSLFTSTTATIPSTYRHARTSAVNMRLVCALAFLLAPAAVLAEVQDDFTFPKSGTKIAVGQKITIAWTSNLQTWFPAYCPSCVASSASLYITSIGISGQVPFRHKIASKIDVTSSTSLDWKVDIPEAEYTCQGCSNWAFRFETDSGNSQVSSSTFSVTGGGGPEFVGGSQSSSASPGSTTTATVIVSSNPPSQTNAPVPTNAPSTDNNNNNNNSNNNNNQNGNSDSGLTTGAKAGIAIGAIIGAIFMVVLGWFLSQWNKRRNNGRRGTHIESGSMISSGGRAKGNSGPRHRELADFMTDKVKGGGGWDPKDTFHPSAPTVTTTISVRTNESVPDFLGLPPHTPDNASFELLPRSASRG